MFLVRAYTYTYRRAKEQKQPKMMMMMILMRTKTKTRRAQNSLSGRHSNLTTHYTPKPSSKILTSYTYG